MVAADAKKAHVVKWATPSRYIGLTARVFTAAYLAYTLATGAPLLWLSPFEQLGAVTSVPFYRFGSAFAFTIMFFGSGYHYKALGVWMPCSTLVDKKED
eukprot:4883067-Prymnesium_polylepis.1